MSFPSRYRDKLVERCDGEVVVTVDPDRCLLVYPLPEWEVIEQKLVKLPSLKPQTRRLQRLLMGHATESQLDGSGRILLPPPLREFASLDKKVVLIGQGNKFELWDEGVWGQRCDQWLEEAAEDYELSDGLESISL
ncbi:MraZ protein [Natronocella acetinitrilica]|jgi:MraZ protein|uniref:Transcriptional regulator MraZ n=2 Tax=Natronocella acetinitrilica TaxID=414046 RepID=A0AAE3KAR7_9GAMM|nr:MraZ protein [Natronocella acetinitrilica]